MHFELTLGFELIGYLNGKVVELKHRTLFKSILIPKLKLNMF